MTPPTDQTKEKKKIGSMYLMKTAICHYSITPKPLGFSSAMNVSMMRKNDKIKLASTIS